MNALLGDRKPVQSLGCQRVITHTPWKTDCLLLVVHDDDARDQPCGTMAGSHAAARGFIPLVWSPVLTPCVMGGI